MRTEVDRLEKRIRERLKDRLQIGINVKIVEPMSIPRSEGKAKRVIDLRND